jgi:iron only hydrogenase large subunit-like protein
LLINIIQSKDIYSVSIMPCTSKKDEAQRAEMTRKGIPDIDTVLTTRELVRLIRLNGIDILSLEPENTDEPMGSEQFRETGRRKRGYDGIAHQNHSF